MADLLLPKVIKTTPQEMGWVRIKLYCKQSSVTPQLDSPNDNNPQLVGHEPGVEGSLAIE